MSGPVRINSREVVTRTSGGISLAFGDVCVVPGGGPLPFLNVAVSADAAGTSRAVRVHGVPVVLARSTFARSVGDEAGADGGVLSRVTQGPARFANYSYDVRIEGQSTPRALDPMLHNLDSAGLPNAASPAEMQATGSQDPDLDVLCAAICFCREGKMECLRQQLGTPIGLQIPTTSMDPDAPPGHKSFVRYWDPKVPPGWYVEPSYDMGPPPTPMLGEVKSATMRDANGNPLPLPGGDFPSVPGSRRPDIVIPLDPTKPPGPGNIKRIFEVKFPPDSIDRDPTQLKAYQEIAGNAEVDVVGPDDCDCGGRHRDQPHKVPVPSPDAPPVSDPQRREDPDPVLAPDPHAPSVDPTSATRSVGIAVVLGLMLIGFAAGGPGGAAAGAAAGAALTGAGKKDEPQET